MKIEITSSSPITIEAFTPETVIFEGRDDYWFYIIGENADVTINNIIFKNGQGFDGGAIEVNGKLTLNGCVFENNLAETQSGSNG